MIRSAFIRPAINISKSDVIMSRRASLMVFHSTSTKRQNLKSFQSFAMYAPSSWSSATASLLGRNSTAAATSRTQHRIHAKSSSTAIRAASSSSANENKKTTNDNNTQSTNNSGEEPPTSQEIVLTPGEKVVVGTRLFFWAGALSFASVCAYYIGKELLPTKMSPNTVFDKATNAIRQNEEVKRRFGEAFKTYGRDHGGHREGRRNFIEHTEYTSQDDGSKRTRVRFNLEGQYGNAFVFAEVSKDMDAGEFVYILVQDKRNGQVITVCDNRSALLAKRLAGGSREGENVFANLLGGGKKQ
eukprot:scaffold6459_cov21-Cyclotella_meneghiniana.AAC.2